MDGILSAITSYHFLLFMFAFTLIARRLTNVFLLQRASEEAFGW